MGEDVTVNKAILVGNLGCDPELRYTNSGKEVCNFTLATTEKYNDKETTEWHRIVAWGKTAELCQKYLGKGRRVYIEGRISTRKYQAQDGSDRYATEIVAQTVQFLSSNGSSSQGHRPQRNQAPADDDIPFR